MMDVSPARSKGLRRPTKLGGLAVLVSLLGVFVAPATTAVGEVPPNVLVIVLDDQRAEELNPTPMPNVSSWLVDQGVVFSNGIISDPLCCPSRASILTGMYSHSNHIYGNGGKDGGYGGFKRAGNEAFTMAKALHLAGYFTGLVGKYLNGYGATSATHVPSGWNQWRALLTASTSDGDDSYYNWQESRNGTVVSYGSAPGDYSTDVLGEQALNFLKTAPADRPFFLYFAPFAPHTPSTPPNRYKQAIDAPDFTEASDPAFNETDVSDKPAYIQAKPLTDPTFVNQQWNRHWEASRGVDDAIGALLNQLSVSGRLANTLIVYLSDQGVGMGEHRLGVSFKMSPYEGIIHVPFVVRWDALGVAPRTEPALVTNVDIASTVAAATQASMPWTEGMDLIPLMQDPTVDWRTAVLLEHGSSMRVPGYCGVRGPDYLYASYFTGETEYYDLTADPYEVSNSAGDAAYEQQVAAAAAMTAELCTPLPPGGGVVDTPL